VYKSDVWRSLDGRNWELVTPGCQAPQVITNTIIIITILIIIIIIIIIIIVIILSIYTFHYHPHHNMIYH
jgi:heme/copper-type cytochrome/quinol oxidase subunit 2